MRNIIFVLLLLINGFANSAIFQVNLTVQDHVDDNPGDGICDIPSGGFCTLRAAIMEANASPGVDIIVLPGNSTIRLSRTGSNENAAATGDLDITGPVAIGAFTEDTEDYPTIDASLLDDRVFHVLFGSGEVSFTNMRIVNGSADLASGGAINISINNQVLINRVWFEDNTADSGGAIFLNELSELNISDSVFKGNGAVSRGSTMTLFGSTEIDKSTIYENINFNGGFQEAVYLGIAQLGDSDLTLSNSTVFDNNGVGIYSFGADLTVNNATFVNNDDRGVLVNPDNGSLSELRIKNSAFKGNGQNNCAIGNDNFIDLLADNWNISSDISGCFELGSTNLNETDPKLTGVKTDQENWHRYFRPGFYSPVVDSAHPAAPGPGIGCAGEDQRGVVRAQDGDHDGDARCDRGAIELLEDVIYYDDFDISYVKEEKMFKD